jgi:hypothetical protein
MSDHFAAGSIANVDEMLEDVCDLNEIPDIGRLVRVWCYSGRLAPLALRMQWMSFLVDVSPMLTRLPACMLI